MHERRKNSTFASRGYHQQYRDAYNEQIRLLSTAQAEHKVERRLLLNVVVREGAAVLKLLAGEDEALLVGRDALLVLDLGLHVVDRVGGLDLKGDGLACARHGGASDRRVVSGRSATVQERHEAGDGAS